ncbi:MAG: hypothetical protein KIT69_18705, partial [Propionibacteriaceae bacterium]|nr:hypothetical protein [Propionibacteriaceae bacterium]
AARITLTLRNTIPDRRLPDGSIRYYYYDNYQLPVPAGVKKVVASSGGATLRTSFRPGSDSTVRLVHVTFPQLRYGRTRTITFDFEIPGSPVRSKDYTRVGDGYAAFAVQSWGKRGQVSVEIVLPKEMEFNSTADGFTATAKGQKVTWRIDRHTQDDGIWSFVSARDSSRVGEHQVTIGGDTVALLSLPGDEAWATFIAAETTKGVPVLEALVGQEWPGGLARIREDVAPAVTGYAWFDRDRREIVLGEEFDSALLYHELTHAWLNSERLTGRWLYEGLTELVAQRAVVRTGGDSEPHKPPKRTSKFAFPLLEWAEGPKVRADDGELYGYHASYTAANALAGELDDATLAALLTAAYRGESAYDPPRTPTGRTTDWRRFLDLVEDRAGVTGAAEIYRTWVLDGDRAESLDERDAAREGYRTLDAADRDWLPPKGLRQAMTEWRFDEARSTIDALAGVAATAGRLQQDTEAAGLAEPEWLRQSWQEASTSADYAALATIVPRALEVTGAVATASEAAGSATGPVAELG